MFYRFDGEWHLIARTTGPAHNILGLKVAHAKPTRPVRVVARAVDTAQAGNGGSDLSPDEIVREVEAGISEANQEHRTAYHATDILFAPDDTPGGGVYQLLARELVRRMSEAEEAHKWRVAG